METIRYARIGLEDLNLGSGTFEARLADGRVVLLNQINPANIFAGSNFYETGSWTPTVGGTATYDAQTGYYTKVGNLIIVMCDMAIDTIGTGSTSGLTGTLPYPVKTGTIFTAAVSFSGLSTSMISVVAHGLPSGTIQLRSLAAAGTGLVTQAILTDGSVISFSGSYLTD